MGFYHPNTPCLIQELGTPKSSFWGPRGQSWSSSRVLPHLQHQHRLCPSAGKAPGGAQRAHGDGDHPQNPFLPPTLLQTPPQMSHGVCGTRIPLQHPKSRAARQLWRVLGASPAPQKRGIFIPSPLLPWLPQPLPAAGIPVETSCTCLDSARVAVCSNSFQM